MGHINGWVLASDSPARFGPPNFEAIFSDTLARVGTELVTLLVLNPGASFIPRCTGARSVTSANLSRNAVFYHTARIAAHIGEYISMQLPVLLKKWSRSGKPRIATLSLLKEFEKRCPELAESLRFLLFELESVNPCWKFFCFCRCLQHAVHLAVQGSDIIDPSSFQGIDACSLKMHSTTSFRMLFCTTWGGEVELYIHNGSLIVKACVEGNAQRLEGSLCLSEAPPCGRLRTRKFLNRWIFSTLPCFRGMAGAINVHMLRDFSTVLRNPWERDAMIRCCFNCAFVLFLWSLGKYRGAHENFSALATLAECRAPSRPEMLMFPPQSYWLVQGGSLLSSFVFTHPSSCQCILNLGATQVRWTVISPWHRDAHASPCLSPTSMGRSSPT